MTEKTTIQKLREWGAGILAKIASDADPTHPDLPAQVAMAEKALQVIEKTGGAKRYSGLLPGTQIVKRTGSIIAFGQPLLTRVDRRFPFNPMFAERGMDQRTLMSLQRGLVRKSPVKDGAPYQRMDADTAKAKIEGMIGGWAQKALAVKDTAWALWQPGARPSLKQWHAFIQAAMAKQKPKEVTP